MRKQNLALNPSKKMKSLKFIVIGIILFVLTFSLILTFSDDPDEEVLTRIDTQVSEGLDLVALTGLVKEIRGGQELERRLNEKERVNNLDLDADGSVDYLMVTSFGQDKSKVGYSITVQPAQNETQEIATVTVEKNGDQAEIQVIGNEQIYGKNAIYNDFVKIERPVSQSRYGSSSNINVHHSYFGHALWTSLFFYGFYPSYYSYYPVLSGPRYYQNSNYYSNRSTNRGPNRYQRLSNTNISNPNQGKAASTGIRRSLSQPTKTQKQFQSRAKTQAKSGGFGSKRRSSLGSGSSKGFSSKSFGSSSVRSGGFGSRSSGFGK